MLQSFLEQTSAQIAASFLTGFGIGPVLFFHLVEKANALL